MWLSSSRPKVTTRQVDKRIDISFQYHAEAVEIVKALPGAKYCAESRSWSVSVRYRKRVDEAVERIEALLAGEAQAQTETLKALDDDAAQNPLPQVFGFRTFSKGGRWFVVTQFDPALVTEFKSIAGVKWDGSAWTFPAGARQELTQLLNRRQQAEQSHDLPAELTRSTNLIRRRR